jgi:transposase
MGNIQITLSATTLNELNILREEFEKSRNLGGLLKIIAIRSIAGGLALTSTADLLRVGNETIKKWISNFLRFGVSSLKKVVSKGRPKVLSDSEVKSLQKLLANPPEKFGLHGGCWDAKKIGVLIFRSFGKVLAVKYIPEFLRKIGFRFKKARIVAGVQNEGMRQKWIESTWPKILEVAEKQDAHIMFGDEAYFSIFGTSSYTWSLSQDEPTTRSTGSKQNVHILGAINYKTGKPHALLTEGIVDEDVFICYLKTLLKETRKYVHLIVDNVSYHKSAKIRTFLETVKDRLCLHYLPPYSPDYNPIEGFWKKLKKQTTHNVYFESIQDLRSALTAGLRNLRDHPSEIMPLFGFYEKLS